MVQESNFETNQLYFFLYQDMACKNREVHLLDVGLFKRRAPKRPLDNRLAHLQDAFPQQL